MSEDLTSLLSSLQVYAFQEKLCVLQQINLCPSNKLKKKRLVSGLVTEIIPPKFFEECTTIPHLKL